jgi:hypothetical protein
VTGIIQPITNDGGRCVELVLLLLVNDLPLSGLCDNQNSVALLVAEVFKGPSGALRTSLPFKSQPSPPTRKLCFLQFLLTARKKVLQEYTGRVLLWPAPAQEGPCSLSQIWKFCKLP